MESPRISVFYRSLIVLAGVLLLQLLMLGYQLRTQSDIPLIRLGTALIIEPIHRGLDTTSEFFSNIWTGYLDLRHAREESRKLSARIDRLKLQNQALEAAAGEASRLRSLLDLKTVIPGETVAARVLGGSAGEASRLIMIDKGSNAGIKQDSPVIVPDGVVGKVLAVFPTSAQVILLSDPFSGAGVLLEQTRMHGVLKGRNSDRLQLDFIPNGEQVAVGQRVFTSGEDKIYPPGLAVGVVESAAPGAKFMDIAVRPLAALQSLEEVLVILSTDFALPLPEPSHLGPEIPSSAGEIQQKPEQYYRQSSAAGTPQPTAAATAAAGPASAPAATLPRPTAPGPTATTATVPTAAQAPTPDSTAAAGTATGPSATPPSQPSAAPAIPLPREQ